MKYLPKGCLKEFLTIPQVVAKDVSSIPTPVAAQRVKAYWEKQTSKSPDTQAIEFYTLNALVAIIRARFNEYEPLPTWAQDVMKAYVGMLTEQGQRMYAYMFLIIAREARHNHNTESMEWFAALPEDLKTFLSQIQDSSAESAVKQICDTPPNITLGEYVQALEDIFKKGKWGGGYGGKPWGRIAACLNRMVRGETSLELMIDSAYSLAHNNGPMFNKGMMYGHYSGEFIKLLDVQRAGQMPEAVLTGKFPSHTPDAIRFLVKEVQAAIPGIFGAEVDMAKVQKDGLGKYGKGKKKPAPKKAVVPAGTPKPVGQWSATPPPTSSWSTPVIEVAGKKAEVAGEFKVMPGVTVTMLKRVA